LCIIIIIAHITRCFLHLQPPCFSTLHLPSFSPYSITPQRSPFSIVSRSRIDHTQFCIASRTSRRPHRTSQRFPIRRFAIAITQHGTDTCSTGYLLRVYFYTFLIRSWTAILTCNSCDDINGCYYSDWYVWGRWVALACIIVFVLFLALLFS